MYMKKRMFVIALLLLTIINLVGIGNMVYHRWLKPESSACFDGCDGRFEQMIKLLSLRPEQIARMDTARHAFHTELKGLSDQLVVAKVQLADCLAQETPNEADMKRILNEIGRLQSDAQKRVIKHLLLVKSFLDPGQQKKFFTIVQGRFGATPIQPMSGRPLH